MNYEMPTYIQKGMIADNPNTPLLFKNQLYKEKLTLKGGQNE